MMPFFAEQMEMLTNELRTSTRERATFVSQVQEQTHKHLAEAQVFLHTLAEEHGAMSEHLRDSLATHRHEQSAAVDTLREQNRNDFQEMRSGMRERLAEARVERQRQLAELRIGFQTVRDAVTSDLRQAAQVWSQRSRTPPTNSQGGQHHPAHPSQHRAAHASHRHGK